mmetsp:Transcript_21839/g.38608  ORF Transcript_21839/g.38608 Transcript_21839/m.38608 type:complete len:671 (+) Transcript_21839:2-2014(+)
MNERLAGGPNNQDTMEAATNLSAVERASLPLVIPKDFDYTTLEAVYANMMKSRKCRPDKITGEMLKAVGIDAWLLYYQVASAELPVYPAPVPLVSLRNDSSINADVKRWLKRGEFVLGVTTKPDKKALWTQLSKDEWVPVKSNAEGFQGTIVHLKFVVKLNSISALNAKPFEKRSRVCSTLKQPQKETACYKYAYAVKETRRLLRDYDLLRISRVKVDDNEVLTDLNTLGFTDKMLHLYRSMSEVEICKYSEWALCSLHSFCTWTYDIGKAKMKCKHTALEQKHENLGKFYPQIDTYNKSLEFVDNPQDGKRYFVYQPSGGFNNQRIQMEIALNICILTKRTCVIPHAAQHTNYYFRYNLHPAEYLISMQRIFDFERLLEIADVVTIPEDMNLMQWIDSVGGTPYISQSTGLTADTSETNGWRVVMRDARKMAPRHVWKIRNIAQMADDPCRFLFFANHTMWSTIDIFIYSPSYKAMRNSVTYIKPLKDLAITLANKLGNFNSLHVRRGDKKVEANFADVVRDIDVYGQRMRPYQNLVPTLYVATDESDSEYFEPLRKMGYDLKNWEDLDKEVLDNYLTRFPRQMYRDVLGMIEQMLCTYSYMFLGSPYSTFTMYILRLRKYYPLLGVYNTTSADGVVTVHQPTSKAHLDFSVFTSTCNPAMPEAHKTPC